MILKYNEFIKLYKNIGINYIFILHVFKNFSIDIVIILFKIILKQTRFKLKLINLQLKYQSDSHDHHKKVYKVKIQFLERSTSHIKLHFLFLPAYVGFIKLNKTQTYRLQIKAQINTYN